MSDDALHPLDARVLGPVGDALDERLRLGRERLSQAVRVLPDRQGEVLKHVEDGQSRTVVQRESDPADRLASRLSVGSRACSTVIRPVFTSCRRFRWNSRVPIRGIDCTDDAVL